MITGAPTLDAAEPLVSVQHYDGPPHPRAADLITRARVADEEMSFTPSTHPTPTVPPTITIEVFTNLHRWSAPIATEPQLAGVITLGIDSGTTTLDIVVAPEFRSTGVATAAIEYLLAADPRVFASAAGEVVACAYGSHPAALRLSNRFGAVTRNEVHHMLLPSASAYQASRLAALDTESATAPTVEVTVTDGIGFIGHLPVGHERPAALRTAIVALLTDGAQSIEATTDADDAELIDLLRSAAFGHDRTDVVLTRSV